MYTEFDKFFVCECVCGGERYFLWGEWEVFGEEGVASQNAVNACCFSLYVLL